MITLIIYSFPSGAAIQGAILSGVDKEVFQDVLMMDMLPLSIGLEGAAGDFTVMLPRNSPLPCTVSKTFATDYDNQRGITVNIFEGNLNFSVTSQNIPCK
jgi:heat shock protein 1/8